MGSSKEPESLPIVVLFFRMIEILYPYSRYLRITLADLLENLIPLRATFYQNFCLFCMYGNSFLLNTKFISLLHFSTFSENKEIRRVQGVYSMRRCEWHSLIKALQAQENFCPMQNASCWSKILCLQHSMRYRLDGMEV